jgi:poly-gamma-glutamate synthesis protein (capsule biosynthesis protein)
MSHWGFEYSFYPLPYQMRLARRMVDAGASVVLGHGPHYPQGIETYRGAEIVYSLGNFIFDEPQKFANRSFIYGVDVAAGVPQNRTVFPVHLRRHVPHLVGGDDRRRLDRLVEALGRRYREKDRRFWRSLSADYLTDLCGRVIRSRSLKYLFVPTLSFYRDVGPAAVMRKLKLSNVMGLSRALNFR